jgi:hypothetical protein
VKRESVNFIRYLLEEWVPSVLRDSPPILPGSVCDVGCGTSYLLGARHLLDIEDKERLV